MVGHLIAVKRRFAISTYRAVHIGSSGCRYVDYLLSSGTVKNRSSAVDFGRRRSIEGEIGSIEGEKGKKKKRKRRKKKRRRKPSVVLAHASSLPLRRRHPRVAHVPYRQYIGTLVRNSKSNLAINSLNQCEKCGSRDGGSGRDNNNEEKRHRATVERGGVERQWREAASSGSGERRRRATAVGERGSDILEQLKKVDCIVYAMGSLFTSICPSLVLHGIGEIIASRYCIGTVVMALKPVKLVIQVT
ncbi:hypothetical protein BHM03_00038845 [Ensete ventricosum]|nr:hypothetical protein BHM03_00038845 [Ensete ventricosum]